MLVWGSVYWVLFIGSAGFVGIYRVSGLLCLLLGLWNLEGLYGL